MINVNFHTRHSLTTNVRFRKTYHHLKDIINAKYGRQSTAVGDEGGFAPNIGSVEEALDLLVAAIDKAGYTDKIYVGSDPAASEFYNETLQSYDFDFKRPENERDPSRVMKPDGVVDFWNDMINKYPIKLLEDPFQDMDFDGHAKATKAFGDAVEVVGDDLYCTNPSIVQKGIDMNATNAMLLKVNQIGTVSEAIRAYHLCVKAGVSSRMLILCLHSFDENLYKLIVTAAALLYNI